MILDEVTSEFYILNMTSTAKMGICPFRQNFSTNCHISEII